MAIKSFAVGDILVLKKNHACGDGANKFDVIRLGSDVRIRCRSCSHDILIQREKLEKGIKSIISEKDAQVEKENV